MLNLLFIFYGFLAMLAQLIIFRELSVLFYGSELFLGTFLSSWLFWTGMGSLFARKLLKKERPFTTYFSYSFLAISLLFPVLILLIRISRSAFAFGEFIGLLGTILYTFCAMSILCFVIGAQFSLACCVCADKVKKEAVLARVYFYEVLGGVVGGVVFTYILIGAVATFTIALVLSLGCIFAAFMLLNKKKSFKSLLLILGALVILFTNFKVEPKVNRIEWKGYQFISQLEARNATLSFVNSGSTKNVFVDGVLSASFPGPENYEPVAHWPLLAAASAKRILIIGDTSLGVLKEALKHSPDKIDYVVSDSSLINFSKPYLLSDDLYALRDPAVRIYYADSRVFIRSNKNKYDVVIINIPEVPNLKTNRFYTEEFYRQIRSILNPAGILGLSVVSSENYLSYASRIFNASVYATLKSVFKAIEVIPGDNLMFLASPLEIDTRKEIFLGRFISRGILNNYVIPSYLEYKLEGKRRGELENLLKTSAKAKINRDFLPTTCYYFTNFWLSKFVSPLGYFAAFLILIIGATVFLKKGEWLLTLAKKKELILIFFFGFISMLLELILLLSYQIISGYIYWQMGLLFASFMLGLFLGSSLGSQFKGSLTRVQSSCLITLALIIIGLSLSLAYFLPYFRYLPAMQNIFIFCALLITLGVIVGSAFVIASFFGSAGNSSENASSLYASDLWGASAGALLSANFIVPVFGILGALYFAAIIGATGLAIFLFKKE